MKVSFSNYFIELEPFIIQTYLQFVYENSFLESFGNDINKAKIYMDQVVAHMQTYYCLASLGTQLEIVVSYLNHWVEKCSLIVFYSS